MHTRTPKPTPVIAWNDQSGGGSHASCSSSYRSDWDGIACLLSTATAQAAVDFGTLACNVGAGAGFIIGSSRPLAGTYNGPAGPEHYTGSVTPLDGEGGAG